MGNDVYNYYFGYEGDSGYKYTYAMTNEGFWKLCTATGWHLSAITIN